jgi:hypothetical protein
MESSHINVINVRITVHILIYVVHLRFSCSLCSYVISVLKLYVNQNVGVNCIPCCSTKRRA